MKILAFTLLFLVSKKKMIANHLNLIFLVVDWFDFFCINLKRTYMYTKNAAEFAVYKK